jgi:hypothetical protein
MAEKRRARGTRSIGTGGNIGDTEAGAETPRTRNDSRSDATNHIHGLEVPDAIVERTAAATIVDGDLENEEIRVKMEARGRTKTIQPRENAKAASEGAPIAKNMIVCGKVMVWVQDMTNHDGAVHPQINAPDGAMMITQARVSATAMEGAGHMTERDHGAEMHIAVMLRDTVVVDKEINSEAMMMMEMRRRPANWLPCNRPRLNWIRIGRNVWLSSKRRRRWLGKQMTERENVAATVGLSMDYTNRLASSI